MTFRQSYRYMLTFWLFWLVWIFIYVGLVYPLYNSFRYAIYDSFISNSVIFLISLALTNALRYYSPGKGAMFSLLGLLIFVSAGWTYAAEAILFAISGAGLENLFFVRVVVSFLLLCLFLLLGWGINLRKDHVMEKERHEESEKALRHAELNQLRQQLQPHFLFNSLNSIYSLSLSDPEQARSMISKLSDFMRNTVKKDAGKMVKLEEELSNILLYLEIEKVRFGNRLEVETECGEREMEAMIPSLLLQPVVENAIKFGLYGVTEKVLIRISCKLEGKELHLTIRNPFGPEAKAGIGGTGFGLSALRKRLYLIFNRSDLVITEEKDFEFTTLIKVPQ